MIAYLITAYDEFDAVADLVGRLYDPRDLYCICVSSNNTAAISEALDQLNGLTALPNIRIIATRAAPHGGILENLLTAIDFCLKFDQNWQSLILLTGSHIAVASPSAIRERISEQFRDKIVLEVAEHPRELAADSEILERLFDDPFRLDAAQGNDNVVYNPFTYSRLSLERAGTSYYVRPGAMRAGWSRSSHFVGNLFWHTFVPEHNEVHVDTQPRIVRRLLERFFEDRPMSACLAWGIMPRDFCGFCLDSPQAQTYFGLIYNCFAAEEPFFATLALDPVFRERIVTSRIVDNAPRAENILTMEDVDNAVAQEHLFARKAPAGNSGREFRTEVYARLGIPNQLDIAHLRKPRAMGYRELLPELLRQNLRFAGTRFTMGIFSARQLAEFTILPDFTLEYHEETPERKEPAGHQWRWREAGYDAFSAHGDPVGRFDGFRIHGGRLLVFGHWPWAEALTLACVADLAEMLPDPPSSPVLRATDGPAETFLEEHRWRYWSSERELGEIQFCKDGTIRAADDPGRIAGYWRAAEAGVIAFGLDDMPISLFDQVSGEAGKWHLAGATWGRHSPVEPCSLVTVARVPAQPRGDSGAALHSEGGDTDGQSEIAAAWEAPLMEFQPLSGLVERVSALDLPLKSSDVVQSILALFEAPRYLEIGVQMGETFFAVTAPAKVAVDPKFVFDVEAARAAEPQSSFCEVESDQFFGVMIEPGAKFDVIFLDGLHTLEQTLRDFCNSIEFLTDGGVIVIDDIEPNSYAASLPDLSAATKLKAELGDPDWSWMGDVYKLVFFIDTFFQQYDYATIVENRGQLVVWRGRRGEVTRRTVVQIGTAPFESVFVEKDAFRRRTFREIIDFLERRETLHARASRS
jgi:hypothetical protein